VGRWLLEGENVKQLELNRRVRRGRWLLLLSLSIPACFVRAGSDVWVGGAPFPGSTTLWTAPGNWQSGNVPPSGSDLTFGLGFASGTNINLLEDQSVGMLTIDTSTPINIVNTGTTSTLSLLTGITRTAASTGTQTISAPVIVGSGGNWSIDGPGGFVVTGPISNGTGTGLNVTGAGALTLGVTGVNNTLYHLGVTSGSTTLGGGQLFLTSTEIVSANMALVVGSASTNAELTVTNGTIVEMSASGAAQIDGGLSVLGSGTIFKLPFASAIGANHSGHLSISDHAIVAPKGSNSQFLLGLNQNGILDVQGGASLSCAVAALAVSSIASATATVSDTDSKWNIQHDLQMGGYLYNQTLNPGGAATLNIQSGGQVTSETTTFYSDVSSIVINGGSLMTGALNGTGGSAGSIVLKADPATGPALVLSNNNGDGNASYAGAITGPGTLFKDGAYQQSLSGQNDFGKIIVNGGTLSISSDDLVDSLTIAGTSKAPTARLDMGSALLLIRKSVDGIATSTTNTAALSTVRDLLAAGYHNGAFDSNGIASSFDHGSHPFAVAYERQIDRVNDGQRVDPTMPLESILIFNTFAGDANMDSLVNFADLVRVAQNYGKSGKFWNDGDFNYDGNVDFADLVAVAQSYGTGLPSAPVPGASVEFEADLARAFAEVPEPSLLGIGCLAVLGRRRKNQRGRLVCRELS
jgi:T5SS/PEP-CTERM-associated repeat protein